MNERNSVRYDSDQLPGKLSKISISWAGNAAIESDVNNFCAHGIRVSIPSVSVKADLPKKNDTVRVFMPFGELWFTGMCVYSSHVRDDSVSLGIYFHNPGEQNYLNNLLLGSLKYPSHFDTFVSDEWEELVARLCESEDPHLNSIGCQEMENIKAHQGGQLTRLEAAPPR